MAPITVCILTGIRTRRKVSQPTSAYVIRKDGTLLILAVRLRRLIFIFLSYPMASLEDFLSEQGFSEPEVLGEGSSATVLVAYSEVEKDDVALKVLSCKSEEFQVENETLDKLNGCSRIIKKYRTIQHPGQEYAIVVLEMLDHDLMDTIEASGAFEEPEARSIFYNICRAVLSCHNKKIAHLDIKPENILLNKTEEHVVLTDFGTAVAYKTNQSETLKPVGTFFYCSPEITRNQGCFPDRADIWSLGILLHVILTGTWPFAGNSYDEACENAEKGVTHCLKKKLSKAALDLIEKMIVINPLERLNIVEVLEHHWFQGITRRQSEMEQRLCFNLDPSSPATDKTSLSLPLSHNSAFIPADSSDSPRKRKIDLSSMLSPRIANLNEVPLSERLSQLDLKSKINTANGLKTPRQTGSLTPRITPNPEQEPTEEELKELETKKQPGALSSLFKKMKDITTFKK